MREVAPTRNCSRQPHAQAPPRSPRDARVPARPRGRRLGGSAPAPTPHPPAARSLRLAPSTAGCAGCSCGGAGAGGHQQHAAPPPAAADVHLVKPAERLVPTAAQQLWLCRTATARWPRRGLKKQRTCAIHCPRQAVGQPGAGPANTGPREGLTETGLQVRPSRGCRCAPPAAITTRSARRCRPPTRPSQVRSAPTGRTFSKPAACAPLLARDALAAAAHTVRPVQCPFRHAPARQRTAARRGAARVCDDGTYALRGLNLAASGVRIRTRVASRCRF